MRPRRGTGQRFRARELRTGDVMTGNGWTVLALEEATGNKVRVSLTRVTGAGLLKVYDADEIIEVVRRA